MRRLDWFLAGVVISFLIGAAVIETSSWTFAGFDWVRTHGSAATEVTARRLVSHLAQPILGGDAP